MRCSSNSSSSESQYRSRFKKWKVHKHSMLKTAEKTTTDGPVQMSDIMAAQEACHPLRPLTIERYARERSLEMFLLTLATERTRSTTLLLTTKKQHTRT